MDNKVATQTKEQEKPYRVLSLDGGGMRGLYTLYLLKTLAERLSDRNNAGVPEIKDIGKGFDLVVGTSTGGIIASGLAAGINIEKLIALYEVEGKRIFTNPAPRGCRLVWWAFCNLCKPANKNDHLKKELEKLFQDETVAVLFERRKIALCLTAVNISNGSTQVFKTPHDPRRNADNDRTLVDICLSTSAAPIILPVSFVSEPSNKNVEEGFVDGGLWANNPILVGLIEALRLAGSRRDIEIVSVGNCAPSEGRTFTNRGVNGGMRYWKFGIGPLDLSLHAQVSGYNYMSNFLAKSLSNSERKVLICRLGDTKLSAEKERSIGLDVATTEAISTLNQTGISEGRKIHGNILENSDDKKLKVLNNIFKNLPYIQDGGGK